jgi:hypothetical protein
LAPGPRRVGQPDAARSVAVLLASTLAVLQRANKTRFHVIEGQ